MTQGREIGTEIKLTNKLGIGKLARICSELIIMSRNMSLKIKLNGLYIK